MSPQRLLVAHGRLVPVVSCREPAGASRSRRYLPDSRPPASGLQTSTPTPWSRAARDELVLRLARLQRVVDLLAHVALGAESIGDRERLHEVPAREVRAADVAHLALADQRVERLDRLLDRGLPSHSCIWYRSMWSIRAGAGSPRTRDDVLAREPRVVRPVPHRKARLGRDEQPVAPALDRRAEDLLREPAGVDVGGVDEVDAGVQAASTMRRAPPASVDADLLELAAATERHRAQGERRRCVGRIVRAWRYCT